MSDVLVKSDRVEFYAASQVSRKTVDGSNALRGPRERSLILVMKIPATESHGEGDRVARIVFDPPQNPYADIEGTLLHPAREGEVDANDFLQAVLEHAWSEGFRPKEYASEMIQREKELMARVDELVAIRGDYDPPVIF